MELEGGEMALPLNSTYGGGHGHGHGHMLHHESAPHNHIVPSSAAAAQQQQMPISNGPTIIVPPPSSSSMEETLVVPYTNNNNNNNTRMRMVMVRYRECLKNHAAPIGGTATDGCGEFMPSGEEGTLEALTCSACNCHRNFHRKEIEGEAHHHHPYDYNYHSAPPHLNRSTGFGSGRKVILQHTGLVGTESLRAAPPMIMSYNMGIGSLASEFEEPNHEMLMKKRFRTKFTQEQKEKMLSFAEKLGWKIQKQEESMVQQFCQELGIKRRVLKVWMHNNKHTAVAKKINPVPADPQNQINNS